MRPVAQAADAGTGAATARPSHRSLQAAQRHPPPLHRLASSRQRASRRSRGITPCSAEWQGQDPRQRRQHQQRSEGRTLVEPEVLPREAGREGWDRQGWEWPPPPPPPPPPRPRQKVGQMMGTRRELLASLGFVGVVVLGFQAVDPVRHQAAEDDQDRYGQRGMPSVQYTADGVIVKRPITGSPMKVVGADKPGLLLLVDLRTRDLFEMKLDIDTQVDPYQRDLMNHIFLNPGWELGLRRVPLRNQR